jgi:DNA repair exonuclease SbcCD ATPase subunit
MDSIIGLSYHDEDKKVMSLSADAIKLADNKARLIDEGYIDNGFVIKKGTLEKFLNGQNQYVRGWEFDGEHYKQTEVLNLTNDFVGTVNLGHMDFATMPFILGTWTKDDLSLVEIENDRHALDVQLHLDEDSMFIKELKRQNHDIGISAEFWVHENVEDTEALSETLGYYLPVFDEIYIFAYGLVGECGNVNSSGLELKTKETEMPNEMTNIEELELGMVGENEEVAEEPTELEVDVETEAIEAEVMLDAETETEIPPTEEESAEEATEEDSEASEEESEEAEEAEEEVEEAEVEEVKDEESDDDEDESDEDDPLTETLASLQRQIETLTNTVNELTEQNVALKKTNRKLSNKLQNEKSKKEAFIENVKGLSVALLPNEEKKEDTKKKEKVNHSAYYNGDGIGEL